MKTPNESYKFVQNYLYKHIIVNFDYIKGTNSLNYRLDMPHVKYDFCLCSIEEVHLITELNTLNPNEIKTIKSCMEKDNKIIELIIFVKISDEDKNKIHGQIINIEDISKLKSHIQISQKQLAMGQLAMGMAHDVNNQLMILYGMISQIEDKGQISKELDTIKHVADNSTYMLKQITEFARLDKGYDMIAVNDMVKESIEIFSHNMHKNIILKENYQAEKDCILGKITMLQSVILNIAINARDAMPKGGTINFSTYNINDNGINKIAIKIQDNGEGIDKKILPFIFKLFYTTKETGKGTGLGLSLAKTTIEEHGGTIEVESISEKGAIFIIKLPLADEEKDMEILPHNYVVVSTLAAQRFLLSNYIRKEFNCLCLNFATVEQVCSYYMKNDIEINTIFIKRKKNDKCAINSNKKYESILKQLQQKRPFLRWIIINEKQNFEETKRLIKNHIYDNKKMI